MLLKSFVFENITINEIKLNTLSYICFTTMGLICYSYISYFNCVCLTTSIQFDSSQFNSKVNALFCESVSNAINVVHNLPKKYSFTNINKYIYYMVIVGTNTIQIATNSNNNNNNNKFFKMVVKIKQKKKEKKKLLHHMT